MLRAVNIGGTEAILDLSRRYKVKRLVYTSSIEVLYIGGACKSATEDMPYPSSTIQAYQLTKIEAEKLVLSADAPSLATCALRPGHIIAPGDDLFFMATVPVCFGRSFSLCPDSGAAKITCSHAENLALAHIIAAMRLASDAVATSNAHLGEEREPTDSRDRRSSSSSSSSPPSSSKWQSSSAVHGQAFNVGDFDENIVCVYHSLAGRPPPWVVLPYWLLWLLVRATVACSCLLFDLGGWQLVGPKVPINPNPNPNPGSWLDPQGNDKP
jgi:hypothetical protein